MKLTVKHTLGAARVGELDFRRGVVHTPAFMPVGTYGTVKSVTPEEVAADGADIILGNTFHLMLRPGTEVIRKHGGLHQFMNWQGPILTDSGGFQVFSLAAMRKLSEEGVTFQSPVNGDTVFLTPEKSMEVQHDLNSDVTMIFDECTPYPAAESEARASMELSLRWAARSRARFDELKDAEPDRGEALFGIVQGGMFEHLREESAAAAHQYRRNQLKDYAAYVTDQLRTFDDLELALAAYNAGPARIRKARRLAGQMQLNPDRWFRNVEMAMLKIVGQETVRYVSNINKYYVIYSNADQQVEKREAAIHRVKK